MNPQPMPLPPRFWVGLGLVLVFWALNWGLTGLRTHWGFPPLWLGYCLCVDGLVFWRHGTSLVARSPRLYALLFVVSIPVWWIFEAVNARTQNWHYVGREAFSDLAFFWWGTLGFCTVVPAVLGTAELAGTWGPLRRMRRTRRRHMGRRAGPWLVLSGTAMLAAVLLWPRQLYPLTWGFMLLVAEGIGLLLGFRMLSTWLREGDWRPVLALSLGGLACGFFWELWNSRSYPHWEYSTPGVGFIHVFQMPLLGYLGYPPFALGLFSVTQLALGLCGWRDRAFLPEGLPGGRT